MQLYYPDLIAIQQKTAQLENDRCIHCGHIHQLVSHGYIYKKISSQAEPVAIGKRTICSKRYGRTGCGRTMQLYLDSRIRYMHYAGCIVVAFVWLLVAGNSIANAYQCATGIAEPRNAYRWLNKLFLRLSDFRSLIHKPQLSDHVKNGTIQLRRQLLTSTFQALLNRFGEPLCDNYQHTLQKSFL